MLELLSSDKLASILPVIVVINACISIAVYGLNKFVEIGKLKSDSKAMQIAVQVASAISKVMDFLSANIKH